MSSATVLRHIDYQHVCSLFDVYIINTRVIYKLRFHDRLTHFTLDIGDYQACLLVSDPVAWFSSQIAASIIKVFSSH